MVILGSTGSIGTQALEVVAEHRDQFQVVGLAAGGQQIALLAQQARDSGARTVAVEPSDNRAGPPVGSLRRGKRRGWAEGKFSLPRILAGPDAAADLAAMPCDVVLNGITGSTGLAATLAVLGPANPCPGQQGVSCGRRVLVTKAAVRIRSSPSTPNTQRLPNAFVGAPPQRSTG